MTYLRLTSVIIWFLIVKNKNTIFISHSLRVLLVSGSVVSWLSCTNLDNCTTQLMFCDSGYHEPHQSYHILLFINQRPERKFSLAKNWSLTGVTGKREIKMNMLIHCSDRKKTIWNCSLGEIHFNSQPGSGSMIVWEITIHFHYFTCWVIVRYDMKIKWFF